MAEFLPLREIYSSDEEDDEEILLTDDVDGAGKAFEKYYNKFMDKFGSRKRAKARRKKKAESQEEDQQTKPEVDEHEYDFYNPQRGKAIIINNDTFHASGLKDRKGSEYDATGLKQIFTQLGFDVTLHNNLTSRQMVEKLTGVASNRTYDNSKADCFACAILSHGGEEVFKPLKDQSGSMIRHDVVFGVDGRMVPIIFLLSIFNDECCPELEGKPRLFFIQACRGGKMDDGTEVAFLNDKKKQKSSTTRRRVEDQPDARAYVSESDEDTSEETSPEDKDQNTDDSSFVEKQGKVEQETKEEPKEEQEGQKQGEVLDSDKIGQKQEELQDSVAEPVLTLCPSPIYKDFLLMYAAPPGYFAWRRENGGGWLMHTLINVVRKADLTSVPLTKLLTTVCRRVAMEYQTASKEKSIRKKKLVPCVMSMLTKDVYFRGKAK